ncbi:MAG: dihydrolipoyl dehydrogenase [Desulfobacterales bacterium]
MVMGELAEETQLLVMGGGPGGYAAAFRAADLGLEVTLVDRQAQPGGVCLHKGCIPSKTLLSLAELILDAHRAAAMGLSYEPPRIDLPAIRAWRDEVTGRLARGLVALCEKRGVRLIQGRAEFESPRRVRVQGHAALHIDFEQAIIATGSRPAKLQGFKEQGRGRIMDSTSALALADIPESLLVVGGGYVGLELGTVYAALGSRVSLMERVDGILPMVDRDLTQPLMEGLKSLFAAFHFNTHIESLEPGPREVRVRAQEYGGDMLDQTFDRVLVAVGRRPNSGGIGLEKAGLAADEKGLIPVDDQMRTAVKGIFAVGDVTEGYGLAHEAMRQGKVAAEVITGRPSAYDVRAVPAVVFTDPQVAWCGLTESQARAEQQPVEIRRFPWGFSGRAVSMGAPSGLTKMIADPDSGRVLGVGIVGRNAENLIAEGVLAVEMGALVEDVALSMHAHPTLSETQGEAAEIFLESATHILPRRKPPRRPA